MKVRTYRVKYEMDIYVKALGKPSAEKVALEYLLAANAIRATGIETTTGLHRGTDEVVMPDAGGGPV